MSYREYITLTYMEEVRFLFARIGSPKPINFAPGSGFEVADSCLARLRDARRIAQERSPELAECANWGPGYYQVENDDDPPEIEWHALGFEIYRKGQYSKGRCCVDCISLHPNRTKSNGKLNTTDTTPRKAERQRNRYQCKGSLRTRSWTLAS